MTTSPQPYEIRPLSEGDVVAQELPTPAPDQDQPRGRRTVAAVSRETVIGFATMTWAAVTEQYFCEVSVATAHRRRGVGTRLFDAVRELADPGFPIVARAMNSAPHRRAFADSLGCSVLVHCPMPRIDPTALSVRDWMARQGVLVGCVIRATAEADGDQLQAAWVSSYLWVHEPFAAVHTERLVEQWTRQRGVFDPQASRACLDEATGQILALSLVALDAWDGHNLLVAETVRRDQPDGDAILAATVAASISELARRGVDRVEFEGHATDAHTPTLFEILPTSGADPMDILELSGRSGEPSRRSAAAGTS
ncbi:MAG: GNAT family N-acetyltransferase [Propionibacteriales bacterium]|nr:GNAT family N-acetyltransferase [Propionibacteriales bacterium]